MVFWILVSLVGLVTVGTFLYNLEWSFVDGLFLGLMAAILSALVAFMLALLAVQLFPAQAVSEKTRDLRALATSQSVSGRFFLGSGYVDGKSTFNYITWDDGYSTFRQATVSASRVFEDETTPSVTTYTFRYSNPWILPWEFTTGYSWDFHIPEGSILSNYEVKP